MFRLCIFSSTFSIDGRSRSSRGLCWRSWTALGAYVGSLGPLLGPMLAVLGRSLGLCWRSWAALKAYVGGLGSRSGPMWAVLGADQGLSWRSWALCWRSWAKSGSNPSEDAIWQADQGREVAQTRAGRTFWGAHHFPFFSDAGPPCRFFSIDMCRRLIYLFYVDAVVFTHVLT